MKRLLFPSLSDGAAPVSYELGVALLLAWVGHILHGVSDVATRYPSSYWIWQFIDDNDLEKIIPWYALAGSFCICLGLMRVACGCSRGHYLRASGLIIGSSVFALVAFGHLAVTFNSIAGPAYLFLAWRLLELGLFYVWRA